MPTCDLCSWDNSTNSFPWVCGAFLAISLELGTGDTSDKVQSLLTVWPRRDHSLGPCSGPTYWETHGVGGVVRDNSRDREEAGKPAVAQGCGVSLTDADPVTVTLLSLRLSFSPPGSFSLRILPSAQRSPEMWALALRMPPLKALTFQGQSQSVHTTRDCPVVEKSRHSEVPAGSGRQSLRRQSCLFLHLDAGLCSGLDQPSTERLGGPVSAGGACSHPPPAHRPCTAAVTICRFPAPWPSQT